MDGLFWSKLKTFVVLHPSMMQCWAVKKPSHEKCTNNWVSPQTHTITEKAIEYPTSRCGKKIIATHIDAQKNQDTRFSVSCGPRSQHATPISILTGRTIMQFSCIRKFLLLVQNWTIFAVKMPSTISTPHFKFQLNHAKRFWDMNFQKLAWRSFFIFFFLLFVMLKLP